MAPGLNVVSFADLLRGDVERLSETLPAGMQLVQITDQAEVVSTQLLRVAKDRPDRQRHRADHGTGNDGDHEDPEHRSAHDLGGGHHHRPGTVRR
ncbi:hypothetical protein G6F32_017200 [Rhizopus arrhizus]|nr:hypothetical protein G6F32_017200 [Rhizopus arrhizus]